MFTSKEIIEQIIYIQTMEYKIAIEKYIFNICVLTS